MPEKPARVPRPRPTPPIALALLGVVSALVFGQAAGFNFADYDDPVIISQNAVVLEGLNLEGVRYAFTDISTNLWHPLTWLSHMGDVELFGNWAGGHHLTSILLHTLNAFLVFLLLSQLTNRSWPAFVVALFFAVHPLHVESVAWISERKDVLSTFFYLLTLLAYVAWTRSKRNLHYMAALLFCVAGFLSKPSLMTLPFTMLLLDFWPLTRFSLTGPRETTRRALRLVLEKAPFFLLTGIFMAIAWRVEAGGSHAGLSAMTTFAERWQVAVLAYGSYLERTFWPSGLSAFYPHPESLAPAVVFGWMAIFAGATLLAILLARRAPYVLFGWLWFVGLVFPASGIVTISDNFAPDRYSYLAHVGLFVAVVWGVIGLAKKWATMDRCPPLVCKGAALGAVAGVALLLGVLGWRQVGVWKDSESLWSHSVAVTERNYFAHNKLAVWLLETDRADEGIAHLRASVAAKPDFAFAHANLGRVLHRRGAPLEAIPHYEEAIAVKPADMAMRRAVIDAYQDSGRFEQSIPHYRALVEKEPGDGQSQFKLANLLFVTGEKRQALLHYEAAAALMPEDALIRGNLGAALVEAGEYDRGVLHLTAALADKKSPMLARVHYFLGKAHRAQGGLETAVTHYKQAAQRAPQRVEIFDELAWLLATSEDAAVRDGRRAVTLALHANKKSQDPNPHYLMTLGAAYAEAGDFKRAIEATRFAEKFMEEPSAGLNCEEASALSRELSVQRILYSADQPMRQAKSITKPEIAKR